MIYPVLHVVILYQLFCSRICQYTWLIIQFVINFWAVYDQLAQLIPQELVIEPSLVHFHELYFVDGAKHAETQLGVVRVVYEVLRVHHAPSDIIVAHCDKLPIDPMMKMDCSKAWINSEQIWLDKLGYVQV